MKLVLAVLGLMAGLPLSLAEAQAQSVYVPHGRRTVEVPLASVAPGVTLSAPGDGGLVRIDELPAGAALAVDGQLVVGPALARGWITLSPGPHFIDVGLPGGGAVRLTVVTPIETSGYQVVPKP
jgi:hypothetical protein